MILSEIINQLNKFDGDDTIYIKQPWTPESETVVATEPDHGGLPSDAVKTGAEYFLEVFLAQEFLEGWLSNLSQKPSDREQCLRLIAYAENDA
ncbi:hypothetical protein MUU48_21260 [Scandinavium sp. H11S7]|uniref:hypothetical protein n=1 Tax=Scandinavium hiltneri TaxID=2926519 RepID=UPI002165B68D|nr:hypothetical protein [Scandinavium hiltneri]MCS2159403.1 hypothetical protein [Scandinavium hiltneri]